MLTEQQVERYSRQIILPEIGGSGQERLLATTVSIIGRSSLAGLVALYLSRGGIGHLRVSPSIALLPLSGSPDCVVSAMEPAVSNAAAAAAPRQEIEVEIVESSGQLSRIVAARLPLVLVAARASSGAVLWQHGEYAQGCRNCAWRRLADYGAQHDAGITAPAIWAASTAAYTVIRLSLDIDGALAALLTQIDFETMRLQLDRHWKQVDCIVCGSKR